MRASAVSDDCVITLTSADVGKTFKQFNIHKAAGPDRLPGRVPRACADQVSSLTIFNLSLSESVIPTCFNFLVIPSRDGIDLTTPSVIVACQIQKQKYS